MNAEAHDVGGPAAELSTTVRSIVETALGGPVDGDRPLREQGASSFHAVLIAAELERVSSAEIDYAAVLTASPREIDGWLPGCP